jgi:hypothetical protein
MADFNIGDQYHPGLSASVPDTAGLKGRWTNAQQSDSGREPTAYHIERSTPDSSDCACRSANSIPALWATQLLTRYAKTHKRETDEL